MKIALRAQEYSKQQRQALWWHFNGGYSYAGDPKDCPLASREDCQSHLEMNGRSRDEELHYDWQWGHIRYHERKEEARWASERRQDLNKALGLMEQMPSGKSHENKL